MRREGESGDGKGAKENQKWRGKIGGREIPCVRKDKSGIQEEKR